MRNTLHKSNHLAPSHRWSNRWLKMPHRHTHVCATITQQHTHVMRNNNNTITTTHCAQQQQHIAQHQQHIVHNNTLCTTTHRAQQYIVHDNSTNQWIQIVKRHKPPLNLLATGGNQLVCVAVFVAVCVAVRVAVCVGSTWQSTSVCCSMQCVAVCGVFQCTTRNHENNKVAACTANGGGRNKEVCICIQHTT